MAYENPYEQYAYTPGDPMPAYLKGHEKWAWEYLQSRAGGGPHWPSLVNLRDALTQWWNTKSISGDYGMEGSSTRAAADAFQRRRGRLPGLGEMDFALSDLAMERSRPGAVTGLGVEEPAGVGEASRAISKVGQELAPQFQGVGRRLWEGMAGDLPLEYARVGVQQGAPTYYDWLRQKAQTMTRGGQGEQFGPTPITWEQVSGASPTAGQDYFDPYASAATSDENKLAQLRTQAILGAWLAKFAPGATGDLKAALQSKLGGAMELYPRQVPGGAPEGYASYIQKQMAGYL